MHCFGWTLEHISPLCRITSSERTRRHSPMAGFTTSFPWRASATYSESYALAATETLPDVPQEFALDRSSLFHGRRYGLRTFDSPPELDSRCPHFWLWRRGCAGCSRDDHGIHAQLHRILLLCFAAHRPDRERESVAADYYAAVQVERPESRARVVCLYLHLWHCGTRKNRESS